MIGEGIVLATLLEHDTNAVRVAAYEGLDVALDKVVSLLGFDPARQAFSLDDMTPEELRLFRRGRLKWLRGGIHALSTRKLPRPVAVAAEKLLRVNGVYTIGFVLGDQHHGGVSILARGSLSKHAAAIESVVHQAAITIHRMNAETEKRRTERKLRQIFDGSRDGYVIVDAHGRITDCNESFQRMLGYSLAELQALQNFNRITPHEWHQWENEEIWEKRLLGQGYSGVYEKEYIRKDGAVFPVELQSYAVRDDTGPIEYLWGVARDITDRQKAEEAIGAERERLAVTLRSIGDGVITTDTQGKIVILNKVAEELTGWTQREAAGKPLSEVFSVVHEMTRKPCANPVQKVLETGEIIELSNHTMLIARDGAERIIADSGAPIRDVQGETIGVVLVFRDVTEKQKLLQHLQRTEKLDSLGVLAGGIAHDFNNLLGGVFGYLEMARRASPAGGKASEYLDDALAAFNRARALTQQLLTFSKGGSPVRKTGDIAALAKKCASFVLSGSNVACSYEICEGAWLCDYDENQIGQVIDNIVMNAQQAMPQGGTVTVSVRNTEIGDGEIGELRAGRYVCLSVTDQGVGIPLEIKDRIFDPFFTTKQKGSGLGLATSHSIVQKHDGHMEVESIPGKGSTFHVCLPASHKESEEDAESAPEMIMGSGTILVMDDEDVIRQVAREMLTAAGYDVLTARDGEEALKVCGEALSKGVPLKGAIFDLTIPGGMGGREAVVEMKTRYPRIPVFASSGYSEDPIMAQPETYGFAGSIPKPYRPKELYRVLAKATGRDS